MKIRNNKKYIILVMIVSFMLISSIKTTLAYYNDKTESIRNTFSIGVVETEIKEDDFDNNGNKTVTIKNVGTSDCYIRARISVSPKGAVTLKEIQSNSNNWIYNATDDYYYYKNIVSPENSTLFLFKGYEKGTIDSNDTLPVEVSIYQEAVEVVGFETTGYTAAWAAYDAGIN